MEKTNEKSNLKTIKNILNVVLVIALVIVGANFAFTKEYNGTYYNKYEKELEASNECGGYYNGSVYGYMIAELVEKVNSFNKESQYHFITINNDYSYKYIFNGKKTKRYTINVERMSMHLYGSISREAITNIDIYEENTDTISNCIVGDKSNFKSTKKQDPSYISRLDLGKLFLLATIIGIPYLVIGSLCSAVKYSYNKKFEGEQLQNKKDSVDIIRTISFIVVLILILITFHQIEASTYLMT